MKPLLLAPPQPLLGSTTTVAHHHRRPPSYRRRPTAQQQHRQQGLSPFSSFRIDLSPSHGRPLSLCSEIAGSHHRGWWCFSPQSHLSLSLIFLSVARNRYTHVCVFSFLLVRCTQRKRRRVDRLFPIQF